MSEQEEREGVKREERQEGRGQVESEHGVTGEMRRNEGTRGETCRKRKKCERERSM
jgi:hypothetical protein